MQQSFWETHKQKYWPDATKRFDGDDYIPKRDMPRLKGQLAKIFNLMADGIYRTFGEIREATGAPEASISAQLRNLRKPQFGSHKIDRVHCGKGLYKYKLTVNN